MSIDHIRKSAAEGKKTFSDLLNTPLDTER